MPAPLTRRYPVWDDHFHMDPAGRHVEAVKEFARAGGTHLMLVHKPYQERSDGWAFNTSVEDHLRQYDITLRLAEQARMLEAADVGLLLGGLPLGKEHCASLAISSLRKGLNAWQEQFAVGNEEGALI